MCDPPGAEVARLGRLEHEHETQRQPADGEGDEQQRDGAQSLALLLIAGQRLLPSINQSTNNKSISLSIWVNLFLIRDKSNDKHNMNQSSQSMKYNNQSIANQSM